MSLFRKILLSNVDLADQADSSNTCISFFNKEDFIKRDFMLAVRKYGTNANEQAFYWLSKRFDINKK